jgi:hypothetical protein
MVRIISRAAFSLASWALPRGAEIAQPSALVLNLGSNNASGYIVDSVTGAVTEVAGSPFPAGSFPVQRAGHWVQKWKFRLNPR